MPEQKEMPKELVEINQERYVNFARLGELTAMYEHDKLRFIEQEKVLAEKFARAKAALEEPVKSVEAEIVEEKA